MKRYNKVTPDGTRDLLFEECDARDEAVSRLTTMFKARGYRQVMTPAIEFYDAFGASGTYFPQENMYKLTDNHGRLLVMRPDCTIPIARLAATRLKTLPMPLRLYYSQNVYRMGHDMRGKRDEIFQTGVELIGSHSLRSDLEIMELAASGLSDLNGDSFRLEICHIGYFKALIESLDTDDATKEEIRKSVEQKNYASLNDLLQQFGSSKAATALKYLPRLFGGEEVFEKADQLFDQNGAKESLDYLKSIYENLCQLGLKDRVLIDLGLVNQAEYYTGIIFRGYLDGIGEPVLSGGRYDNLINDFGASLCAIGFAVTVDLVTEAIGTRNQKIADALVFAEETYLPKSIRYMNGLIQNGMTVENCVLDDFESAVEHARLCGIKQLHVVDDKVSIIDLENCKGRAVR